MLSRRSALLSVPLATLVAAEVAHAGRAGALVPGWGSGAGEPAAAELAAASVRAFTADLFGEMGRSGTGNLACSPYSVMVALAMTRVGARGQTARELDAVLHAPASGELDAGLGSLDQLISSRSRVVVDNGQEFPVLVQGANSLWGQQGVAWVPEFVATLARYYGAGMRTVDYAGATEQARQTINAWVGENTRERIPELLLPNHLSSRTRLTLVNALYLNAPWWDPFVGETPDVPFTLLDGSVVRAPQMTSPIRRIGWAQGDGWQAVDLPYVGGELAMALVVPDAGRFAEVEGSCDGAWLGRLLAGFVSESVQVRMPPWTFRVKAGLQEALMALGMSTAFGPEADFTGMTEDEQISIGEVVHETFVAVDRKGTEAAAATAVIINQPSIPTVRAVVTADRPFLFVIHDVATATPLFIGRVMDPRTS
jgi:serpin B